MRENISGLDVHKLFSMNLKRLRTKAGLSQLALANEVGLTHNFINDIENSKKWVSPATIAKLTNALAVDTYEFFIPPYNLEENKVEPIKNLFDDISDSFVRAVNSIKNEYLTEKKRH